MSQNFDIIVIGGGIIGLSTALNLLKSRPSLKLLLLEKEKEIATHQTARNSGVIHSGIYYKPGSLKAINCRNGVTKLLEYCFQKKIHVDVCGKLIIATNDLEIPRLKELHQRSVANGVPHVKMISKEEIKTIEPYAKGIMALHSPTTAIVDFVEIANHYAKDIQNFGAAIHCDEKVLKLNKNSDWLVETSKASYSTKLVINCAGFYADRLTHLVDSSVSPKQIIPFRGEYYQLLPHARAKVKGLIYPVPDPNFPFLGVHLSKTITGEVEAGPNAVLAFKREGYSKYSLNFKDIYDYLTYPGFWALVKKHWRVGCYEYYRSFRKRAFLKSLQKLVPSLQMQDLIPADSGVRSQVILPNGQLQDDFLFYEKPGFLGVLNAPSPAATASLAIGETIAQKALGSIYPTNSP